MSEGKHENNFNEEEELGIGRIGNTLRRQLERQLFWWIKVNGKFEGVLVFVGRDFIILVGDDCKIFEINLDEVVSLQKRAPGCPNREEYEEEDEDDEDDNHHHKY